jgi:hypothetical protein
MQTIYLIASGDLRLSANRNCEAAQSAMEQQLVRAIERLGGSVRRAHPFDPAKQHGFIDSQHYGMEVFRTIPPRAPLVVAEAVWQYSHHVLAGLLTHRGPILTVANWSGTWPGLVGMLNLNGCLTKAGVRYSTLWSEDFTDAFATGGLKKWMKTGVLTHDTSHVTPYNAARVPAAAGTAGKEFARSFRQNKAIMGIFDEGCMGMYNAIIPDELLHATGVFKERLSQSTLYARMLTVKDHEARGVFEWLKERGMTFRFGTREEADLTENQVLEQCRMYVAAVRLAHDFRCDAIGIQYQQGLKDLTAASDLAEGMLNNVERPPVFDETGGAELFKGDAVPHFNEVDECAGLDALVTYRLWRSLGLPPENTLHDIRWGRQCDVNGTGKFVWLFEISGAVPPAHLAHGYRSAVGERQPPMYFRLGGSSIKGVSRPGHVVWSRVFVAGGALHYDTGLAEAVALPDPETEERWRLTTPQWPVMHAVMDGITRDQMMARHKSNHIQVVYAPDRGTARSAMFIRAAAMKELGLKVSFCGKTR